MRVVLFARVGGISSTNLSLEISIVHRFDGTNQLSGEVQASERLHRITTIVGRCDEYCSANALFRIRDMSLSYVTTPSTFHDKLILAVQLFSASIEWLSHWSM
jgi:hypothetical protein